MIANIGAEVPSEYATIISTAPPSMLREIARLMTEAIMGPTQGVQTSPRLKPATTPPKKPLV